MTDRNTSASLLVEACCIALAISGHFCENPDEWLSSHEIRLREIEKIGRDSLLRAKDDISAREAAERCATLVCNRCATGDMKEYQADPSPAFWHEAELCKASEIWLFAYTLNKSL